LNFKILYYAYFYSIVKEHMASQFRANRSFVTKLLLQKATVYRA